MGLLFYQILRRSTPQGQSKNKKSSKIFLVYWNLDTNFTLHQSLDSQKIAYHQCWTKGRSSTAVAEDLRPTATAEV